MTSEVDGLKTNEFLRRRKLRLQQVREQSKDIAKKIRQRAKFDQLQKVVELDSKKQREYFRRQERLIKQLEEFHARGIENIGASHRDASETVLQGDQTDQIDVSQRRGREATSELRKKRQQILDQQKKLLDRKLQARVAANEISREKSATVSNKLHLKPVKSQEDTQSKINTEYDNDKTKQATDKDGGIARNDMATQWDLEEAPSEWEPDIPTLALPNDDNSVKETNNNVIDSKSEKRLDLFALSAEMPSSLRGGLTQQEERVPIKSSLTLVSEYLQNRGMRLREPNTAQSSKKTDDLQSLKQTILRTRASKEGKVNSQVDKPVKPSRQNSAVANKSSVTMYNHSTRNARNIPYNDERLVVRDTQPNEDAYLLAMKESSTTQNAEINKKLQENRSKIAMTKQNVEKEYMETISFLNAMPKDNREGRPNRTAFMDEQRQKMQKESRQHKLQQEYRKIEKECRRHVNRKKPRTSRSPIENSDEFESDDFQYSWMPVPESDGNLAIHTIPTSLKPDKSGNTVKFSKVDSYHEYRSQHKHTPPTKDTVQEKPIRNVKATHFQNVSDDSASVTSDSSTENIRLQNKTGTSADKHTDQERIIIYKILDSKIDSGKNKSKLVKDIAKSLTLIDKQKGSRVDVNDLQQNCDKTNSNTDNRISFEQLEEGIYKTVNEGGDNIATMYFPDSDSERKAATLENIGRKHRRGHCCKKSSGHQHHKGEYPSVHVTCENPRSPNSRSHKSCSTESKNLSKDERADQTSAATSATSFKSAIDKGGTSSGPGEGGVIKLVDGSGHEAGKFFIGASGFLKDAYEVVIQLRKKGEETEINENTTENKNKPQDETDKTQVPPAEARSTQTIMVGSEEDIAIVREKSKNEKAEAATYTVDIPEVQIGSHLGQSNSKSDAQEIPENVNRESNIISKDIEKKEAVDRQNAQVLVESASVPANNPLPEPAPRPATSTYTQTSLCSPVQRPVYFHMSSSTSTAYMSPPDMILPQFLRNDHFLTDSEMNDTNNYDGTRTEELEVIEEYKNNDGPCRCRKCLQTCTVSICSNTEGPTRHQRKVVNHRSTPPYSAGSDRSGDMKPPCRKPKCKRHRSAECHYRDYQNSEPAKHSSQHFALRITPSTTSSKKQSGPILKASKNNLKPAIKKYVDQLLVLNKESLKAVQVVDQECSAVSTPGSSIMHVDHNTRPGTSMENKLSLQHIQSELKQKLIADIEKDIGSLRKSQDEIVDQNFEVPNKPCNKIQIPKFPKKKSTHKVKSLNISRNISRAKKLCQSKQPQTQPVDPVLPRKDVVIGRASATKTEVRENKGRSKSSPTPRSSQSSKNTEQVERGMNSRLAQQQNNKECSSYAKRHSRKAEARKGNSETSTRATTNTSDSPMSMSTQTSVNVDTEEHFMKIAEDKLHNMEKIADLTEKCTQRLSNLAKVLEEVRKNKTLAYSQMSSQSDTTSDSDAKSEKNTVPTQPRESDLNLNKLMNTKTTETIDSTGYVPILSDIPKPDSFVNLNPEFPTDSVSSSSKKSPSPPPCDNIDPTIKQKSRPPPALSRIHLKNCRDFVVPHELSTVVEVDSPMSVKQKSSRNDSRDVENSHRNVNGLRNDTYTNTSVAVNTSKKPATPDSNINKSHERRRISRSVSSQDGEVQIIDMKQFNEIMLKPFFSIQEYAKQCNVGVFDDLSNMDDIVKDDQLNDELSSLHSEASLPDVISELLKRNIIAEPFKFDTGSNLNSTTVSTESTLSMLALAKTKQAKKRPGVIFQNKDNFGETSDTLSISSNPDLENAFNKLGMGWASSTLKKTKERLALSSSSNTSSSSLSQFKVKGFNKDAPALVTDAVSSVLNYSRDPQQNNANESSKHAEQQTALSNSMTVKEFLTTELAKKITFNNKSNNETEEFVSLFETKMPDAMKHTSRNNREEDSIDTTARSANRARTSTPVRLFKSTTYNSSSSSNLSNGLFSNADDLSSVKVTSNSMKHSTSDKDDLIIPDLSLRMKRSSDRSKSD